MPRFIIHHLTRYSYDSPVRDSANQIMLFPIKDEFQEVVQQKLTVSGDPVMEMHQDYYGNSVGSFMLSAPHLELSIDSKIEVVTHARPITWPDGNIASFEAMLRPLTSDPKFIDFLQAEWFPQIDEVKSAVQETAGKTSGIAEKITALNQYVYHHFQYIKGVTEVDTSLGDVWKLKAGVCQDFAHILLVMLRLMGIPARYVSGYICPSKQGMRGEGATHAWVEAWLPGCGWLGLDPTNNCLVTDLHVRLAVGRNFSDCSPVKGTYKGTSVHKLEVGVSVLYEDGHSIEEVNTLLSEHPVKGTESRNSWQKHMEMMQQQ